MAGRLGNVLYVAFGLIGWLWIIWLVEGSDNLSLKDWVHGPWPLLAVPAGISWGIGAAFHYVLGGTLWDDTEERVRKFLADADRTRRT